MGYGFLKKGLQKKVLPPLACLMLSAKRPSAVSWWTPLNLLVCLQLWGFGGWARGDTRSWWRVPKLLWAEMSHLPGLLLQLCITGRGDTKGWWGRVGFHPDGGGLWGC